jgi:hypothetical protein
MAAGSSSETLVFYRNTIHHENPEDFDMKLHHPVNLKSYSVYVVPNLISLHRVINYLYFSSHLIQSEGCKSDSPMCVKLFIGSERNVLVYDMAEKINCFR